MTQLLLVRHGETEWNAVRRIQGHSNSALSVRGRRQADAIAHRLVAWPVQAVYTSDLTRALETAAPIAATHGLTALPLTDLREKSYGEWEGLTEAEIQAASPEGWHRYHVLRQIDYPVPGGETWPQVDVRMRRALGRILTEYPQPEDCVVVVGHGGSLRLLVLDALGAPLPVLLRLRLDNASLTLLDYSSQRGGRVLFLNDTGHCELVTGGDAR